MIKVNAYKDFEEIALAMEWYWPGSEKKKNLV